MDRRIFTIGHSNLPSDVMIERLRSYGVSAVADVRSRPSSSIHPQFNREALVDSLKSAGIRYVFLGAELGARTLDQSCYINGKVQYRLLAATDAFKEGLARIEEGMQKFTVTLLCAEGDPLNCHRAILIARYLREREVSVFHILKNGALEDHEASLERLKDTLKISREHFFKTSEEITEMAYGLQEEKIAYVKGGPGGGTP